MKLKKLIKTAEKWSKKIGKPVTIYLPPGKIHNEQIPMIHDDAKFEKELIDKGIWNPI
jgi:hypothetical protein